MTTVVYDARFLCPICGRAPIERQPYALEGGEWPMLDYRDLAWNAVLSAGVAYRCLHGHEWTAPALTGEEYDPSPF